MQYLVSKLVKKETAKASLHRDHRGAQKKRNYSLQESQLQKSTVPCSETTDTVMLERKNSSPRLYKEETVRQL